MRRLRARGVGRRLRGQGRGKGKQGTGSGEGGRKGTYTGWHQGQSPSESERARNLRAPGVRLAIATVSRRCPDVPGGARMNPDECECVRGRGPGGRGVRVSGVGGSGVAVPARFDELVGFLYRHRPARGQVSAAASSPDPKSSTPSSSDYLPSPSSSKHSDSANRP
jgi:hypothetical protein